ncbi:conjugal transfer protein TraG N-terminal domain-containing protein [Marinobacter sp. SS13-12]|uniref:conjugal transfer protein TraG N-terminal domain-containing protein n=1 Tax=Marinobacter sp. SS13-12 TaxID=3050451 RepID=UPI002556295B|nr:conjugal transfer protein TraG N-terminal domain-containing protein [Marinobacter sp. SS13-12]MDK8465884.1 conjugal transfer protein TraG N-terminal domain-containing protein [Marinobacter sp. SS13-12]
MKRILPLLALMFAVALPSTALALDMDFYTYDGFTETVNAFKRISLVFANNQYTTLFAVAVVLGLLLGGLFTVGKGIINFQQSATGLSLAWLMTTLIGVAVFKALITPTGTVHVYDPVRNAYEAVPDVPDLIVLVAGMTNKAERAVQEIVDASAAHPYGTEGMGVGFELLLNATTDKTFSSDYYLQKSIRQYFKDCSKLALVLPSYAVDLAEIKSGTDNLLNQLEDMKSPAMFTTMYAAGAYKAGTVMSCTDAFDNVLQPALNAAPTFDEHLNSVCTKSGFDVAVPAQKTACETKIQNMNLNVFGAAAAPPTQLLRNVVISNAIASVMLDENPDAGIRALTNRSMMNNGLGIAVSANEWMPKIRASVTAIVLGLIPILALFIVTPLFPMALKLIVALLGWIMLWGVMDVILAQIAVDQAYDAVDEIKRHNMGLSAIFLAPESATQALSLFGKARGMGITISAFIAAMLFKMSPYGLTSLAGNWSGHADSAGADAAAKGQSPVESMNHLNALASARGSANLMAEAGWDNVSSVRELDQSHQHYRSAEVMSQLRSMGYNTPTDGGKGWGAIDGGKISGELEGTAEVAGGSSPGQLAQRSSDTARLGTLNTTGSADGRDEAAQKRGMTTYSQAVMDTTYGVMNTGSELSTMASMADRIQQNHEGMSDGQAWMALSIAKNAGLLGQLGATDWHPVQVEKMAEITSSMNYAQTTGVMEYMRDNNLSVDEVYESLGAMRAATAHGDHAALQHITPEQFATARGFENAKHMANTSAEMGARAEVASATGLDLNEQVSRERLANLGTYSFTQDEMQELVQKGWFTQEQVDASPNGTRVQMSLDSNGNVVHSGALSGHSATSNNSITEDSRQTKTDAKTIDVGERVVIPSIGKLAMSKDPEDTRHLADVLKELKGDGQEGDRFNVIGQLAQMLSSVNSSSISGDFGIGTRGEAGVSTGVLENVGLTGSLVGYTNKGVQESESADMQRERISRMAEQTFDILNGKEVPPGEDTYMAAAKHVQSEFQTYYGEEKAEADTAFKFLSELDNPESPYPEKDNGVDRRGRKR